MSDRTPLFMLEPPTGATDGDGPVYDAASDSFVLAPAGGGGSGTVESIVGGAGIAVDSTDPANPVVSATGSGSTDPEIVRDTMAAALVAGANITITPDDAADTITIAAAGGGGGGGSTRSADNPSDATWGAASAYDAEFDTDGSALPSGWSWVNQGTGTFEAAFGAGIIRHPGAGSGDDVKAIVRAIPTEATWKMTGRVTLGSDEGNYSEAGIVLRSSSAGKLITLGIGWNAGRRYSIQYWNSPTAGTSGGAGAVVSTSMQYFSIRRNSATSWDFMISPDGVAWWTVSSARNISTFMTPDQIGFFAKRAVNTAPIEVACHWLRVR